MTATMAMAYDRANRMQSLLAAGNARRIVIRQGGRIVAALPLAVGVVGALAALLADCTINVVDEGSGAGTPHATGMPG